MKLKLFCACVVASAGVAAGASAGAIFNNPYNSVSPDGDCAWSTTCAAQLGFGDDYAAQAFTVTSPVVVTAASFTELDYGVTPTDINWGFAEANGPGGSPGTILQAGTDSVARTAVLGTASPYLIEQGFFNVGPMALGPGTYYFALQGISSTFYTYLAEGTLLNGAYETMDGGVTWTSTYEGFPSVAIGLYGAGGVPEPAAWTMMLLGFGLIGGALRRRLARAVA